MNHQGKKEKVEPVESLSQRRDQFEAFFFNKDPRVASFFNKDQDGSSLKAALLSGSPGVGKTTTATLVCGELGFTYIKMNASDTRSKRTLEEQISHSLSNKTMDGFLLSNFCKIWNEFYIIKMLHSFSCLSKLIFLSS
ncbi:hypothetical protein pdam_00007881 [Pocillopora damicornis]|uniref:ATPase AAA-type core domain-containing protein n=1 Tax=Pocillopora damicornis TaxID=46731 RepID=A0A3M6T8D3_POCDA|nr:hypothetical protein pdam_00007881 [Pocillopora damicornis]